MNGTLGRSGQMGTLTLNGTDTGYVLLTPLRSSFVLCVLYDSFVIMLVLTGW